MAEMKLKPCPFCGGEAKIKFILGKEAVVCKNCYAYMLADYIPIEILIDMWNRRVDNDKT